MSYGYDFSIISFTTAQPQWINYMGLTSDPTNSQYDYSNSMIETAFGLFAAGAIFGALFNGWYCDAYGRRKTLVVAAVVNIVGGALQAGSAHVGMFLAARFITGFAAGEITMIDQYLGRIH